MTEPNYPMADALMAIFGFKRVEPGDPDYIPVYQIDGRGVVIEKEQDND